MGSFDRWAVRWAVGGLVISISVGRIAVAVDVYLRHSACIPDGVLICADEGRGFFR